MYFTLVVSCRDIAFSNNNTRFTHFKYDYSMDIIIYPKDISHFNILIFKFVPFIHPSRKVAKCRIAEYKSESHTAYSNNI